MNYKCTRSCHLLPALCIASLNVCKQHNSLWCLIGSYDSSTA
jgi:hypothetical protein